VTGLPGTGKTTLARRIAADLRLPLIYKDGVKEILFDSLGWSDREWSRRLGLASYDLLFHFVAAQLAAGASLVVESNFSSIHDTPRFLALKERYGFEPIQILCYADGEVVLERFRSRASSPDRHPGHVEGANMAEFAPRLLRGRAASLAIAGTLMEVDTTDFARVDYAALLAAIRAAAANQEIAASSVQLAAEDNEDE
jgi:predicted kinase